MAVGGFWCIFVCICQIVRRAAKTARKNTAVYRRDSSRRSSRHAGGGVLEQTSTTPLHHGATQLQESHPLRPLFMSSRGPGGVSSGNGHRLSHVNRNQAVDAAPAAMSSVGARVGSPISSVIHPDFVERVILPEYLDRMDSPGEDSFDMNEEPPPYDAVEEHMDYPAPPAYTDLFPHRS
ncbi:hypothetical protein ACOMHN_056535 [Nucella lapillus]